MIMLRMDRTLIKVKRVYEPIESSDGRRFFVERLWPRGIKKESLSDAVWLKDIAPSPELRQWFNHDPAKWVELKRRYAKELSSNETALRPLIDAARGCTITLLYSARDVEHNSAILLKTFLEKKLGSKKQR